VSLNAISNDKYRGGIIQIYRIFRLGAFHENVLRQLREEKCNTHDVLLSPLQTNKTPFYSFSLVGTLVYNHLHHQPI